ncbi:hypothetical protein [Spiroplasma endosymbiont of Polydrusus pterygomalis]|uniref:hypothetical protein n=1 Tax=Spiroplasma endosymbiont of Polydrusus pterygomalis TaxID=3139327 RepID=UPI003CCB32E6
MPSSLANSYQPLLTENNNNINISNILFWKSWIKPFTLVTFSSMFSVITASVVAITNYWKETTKFDFINGWNNFISNWFTFISSELINSFFYTLAFFKIEFCLDTLFTNNLNWREKLKTVAKNSFLAILLIFINEVSKDIVYHQLNGEKSWFSLSEDFIFNLGKEIVIVFAWKTFKMCLTNNYNFSNYLNSALIIASLGIGYAAVNVGQTLYTIWNMPLFNFMPNFSVIFASNTISGGFRIVSSSSLTAFFKDIATKWRNGCYQNSSINETDLLQEVIVADINHSYNTFDNSRIINNSSLKRIISYDSFFNIQEVNSSDERIPIVKNMKRNNFMNG